MGNKGFKYKRKGEIGSEGSDEENIGPLRWGWNWNCEKSKCGNENTADCLEWLTLHVKKDKLTEACLKRLSLKSEKYCRAIK